MKTAMKHILHALLIAGFVIGLASCSDEEEVTNVVPASPELSWDGSKITLDEANNRAFTFYNNIVAATNITTHEQTVLSWTGGLTLGDKTNGKLEISGSNAVILSSVKVIKAESGAYYITFEGDSKKGWIYFTK